MKLSQLVLEENKISQTIDLIVERTMNMDFSWDWPGGVAFYGIAAAYEATGDDKYLQFIKNWIDEELEDGLPQLTVNASSIGHILLTLYKATKDEAYMEHAIKMA